ncbi:hypothetical protein HJC23_007437 [Cyclotella cryptica]|uniref:Secreted protein n=1 Tax=Cyclotella cryptica TaxID=29204 RepID=A0ABD3QJC2_9STRA
MLVWVDDVWRAKPVVTMGICVATCLRVLVVRRRKPWSGSYACIIIILDPGLPRTTHRTCAGIVPGVVKNTPEHSLPVLTVWYYS